MDQNPPWFALTVRPRHEKTVAQHLRTRGIEEYLPLCASRRQWTDRKKLVDLPLFAGYVFSRFSARERFLALMTPGVTGVVGFNNSDSPVSEAEIASIRTVLAAGFTLSPCPYVQAGDIVRIERGPLAGVSGTVARANGAWRLIINVELLHRSVAVEVDRDIISLCPSSRASEIPQFAR